VDAFVEFLSRDPEGFPARSDFLKDLDTFRKNWRDRGILFFPHGGGKRWRFLQEAVQSGELSPAIGEARNLDALGMYGLKGDGWVVINSNFYKIADLDVRNLSRFELHAQKMCYYVADFLKSRVPGFEDSYVAHVGVDNGIRTSRRICGRSTLTTDEVMNAETPTRCDDTIGVLPVWDTEMACGEFAKSYTYDVPFGVTVPRGAENLLVASGKSVSTERIGLLRNMVACMMCGQATGVAAALAAGSGGQAASVDVRELQKGLLRQGVYLGAEERLVELGLA
jgi:hypothetical protein